MSLLADIKWNDQGLVAAIAQDHQTNKVLMMAWMNAESLQASIDCGQAVYYSRSRQKLWHKGEESGNFQKIYDIRLDCDGDAILLQVEQVGAIACHTGREHCFYRSWQNGEWVAQEPVIKDPKLLYNNG